MEIVCKVNLQAESKQHHRSHCALKNNACVLCRCYSPPCCIRCTAAWSTLRLNVLSLNQTGVSGSLPPEWGSTLSSNTLGPSLQQLYLHQLQLSGEIPASWVFGLPNVTLFSIWRTNVCGLHPIGGAGLGSLCLDTTGTRLGE